jgi:hypothetical protein
MLYLVYFIPAGAGNQAIILDERCSVMPLKMSLFCWRMETKMRVHHWMYLHQLQQIAWLVQSHNFSGHCRCEQCNSVSNADFVNSLA